MKTKDKIENNLKAYVVKARAHKEYQTGKKVTLKEIISDIATYCGFDSFDTINMIYRGVNNPSLYTALKIAEYFNVSVEHIFNLKEEYRTGESEPIGGLGDNKRIMIQRNGER